MNKKRKKDVEFLKKEIISIKERVSSVRDEEEYAFDNIPENLQSSLKGSESQDAIDILDECEEYLEKIIDKLNEIF